MTDNHTPGPWRVGTFGLLNSGARAVVYEDGRICTVDLQRENVRSRDKFDAICDQREANARLIAASPDLLAAAEALIAWWNEIARHGMVQELPFVALARAAIAKARGVTE